MNDGKFDSFMGVEQKAYLQEFEGLTTVSQSCRSGMLHIYKVVLEARDGTVSSTP
ncbi:hypothetical protein PAXINDRAFT_172656 [Paxillus involutus ATCC 200175]|uniref:Uncharacterized protein n=1 Tax=Paxillus involutus ATCC 200175 TaxID=664439 RepID=A0A0C9T0B1_PAXIN|nr:hypothetical protein PAXINDRAFT_172656 [Paxillus involutus ATCC 200175]